MHTSCFDLIWAQFTNRFWEKVDVGGLDDCWLWKKSVRNDGYGQFCVGGRSGRTIAAHRVAYEIENSHVPDGKWVLHKCDNPSCINPKHLFIGTHKDNYDDMRKKGRGKGQVNVKK